MEQKKLELLFYLVILFGVIGLLYAVVIVESGELAGKIVLFTGFGLAGIFGLYQAEKMKQKKQVKA